jgi:hypothetical protein
MSVMRATIKVEEKWNKTGIVLEKGKTYKLEARGTWIDKDYEVDANGFTTKEYCDKQHPDVLTRILMEFLENIRRIPHANWFALIGTIGKTTKTHLIIGTEKTYKAPGGGELFCYANDVFFAYGNNKGELELEITKIGDS